MALADEMTFSRSMSRAHEFQPFHPMGGVSAMVSPILDGHPDTVLSGCIFGREPDRVRSPLFHSSGDDPRLFIER